MGYAGPWQAAFGDIPSSHLQLSACEELDDALTNVRCAIKEGSDRADILKMCIEYAQGHVGTAETDLASLMHVHSSALLTNVKRKLELVEQAAEDLRRAYDCCKRKHCLAAIEFLVQAEEHIRDANIPNTRVLDGR